MNARSMLPAIVLVPLAVFSAAEAPSKAPQEKGAVPPQITITTLLAQDLTLNGGQVDFSGTITNDSTEVLTNVRITDILPYEYSIRRICRQHTGEPCTTVTGSTVSSDITEQLSPGKRIAFWGSLRADRPHPKTRVSFVIQYSAQAGTSSIVSFAGSHTVQTRWSNFWSGAYVGLKDLALPVVLALLGLGLNFVTNRRDRRFLEQDREKTLRSETWNQMLPASHKLACRFYIPLAGAALGILTEFDKYQAAGKDLKIREEKTRFIFYYTLQLGLKMRDIRYALGGFYFKERLGERIASISWLKIRDYFPGNREEDYRVYFRSLKLIDKKDDLDALLKKLDNKQDTGLATLQDAFASLKIRLADEEKTTEMIKLLELMQKVVTYESNRIYDYWYAVKERMELSSAQETLVLSFFEEQSDKRDAAAYLETAKKVRELESP